jgi:hypothetical protein
MSGHFVAGAATGRESVDSPVGQLARLVCRGDRRYLGMLHAYCDESYSSDQRTTPVYVVAGFVGVAEQWEYFESLWRETTRALGIEAFGCHASKCANGRKDYEGMSDERRREIQYRLIVDIAAARLDGAVSIIDMDGYRSVQGRIKSFLDKRHQQYVAPHVMAVRQCVMQMCLLTQDFTLDPIAFVFDTDNGFGGRAKAWYDLDRKNRRVAHRARLGPFVHADRLEVLGLQAADMLAYAAFRHASGKPAWQWKELEKAISISVFTTDAEFWPGLVDELYAKRSDGAL